MDVMALVVVALLGVIVVLIIERSVQNDRWQRAFLAKNLPQWTFSKVVESGLKTKEDVQELANSAYEEDATAPPDYSNEGTPAPSQAQQEVEYLVKEEGMSPEQAIDYITAQGDPRL